METLFIIWLILSGVYVIFRIEDFGKFWWKVITTIPIKLWEVIKSWTGKK
jgi:hypothetical protein